MVVTDGIALSAWTDWFLDTVTWERLVSIDKYRTPTYAAPITYTARIVAELNMLRDSDGNQAVSRTKVLLANSTGIQPSGRLTLPAYGAWPIQPPILHIARVQDAGGLFYEAVYT